MPSNRTYICPKHAKTSRRGSKCPTCGQEMVCLGKHFRVSKGNDIKTKCKIKKYADDQTRAWMNRMLKEI